MDAVGDARFDGGTLFVNSSFDRVGIGTASPSAKLHIAGTAGSDGIRFPDNTLQTSAAKGMTVANVTFDFANIAAGGTTTITVTPFAAALTTDCVVITPSDDLGGIIISSIWIPVDGQMRFRLRNVTSSAIDLPELTYRIVLIHNGF